MRATQRFQRPRFSLLTLFIATALVCVSIAHWRTSGENRRLRQWLYSSRSRSGFLNVADPQAAYVGELAGEPWGGWPYRVYLPPNKDFDLHVCEQAGIGPLPTTPGIQHPSGLFTVVVDARRRSGQTRLTVVSTATTPPIQHSWLLERPVRLPWKDWVGAQQKLDPDEPIVLLDHISTDDGGGKSRLLVYFAPRNN